MVQVESSPGYDGFVEEHRPQDGGADDGLRAAVRGLIDSVTATSHQFADAAENFAQETMRVIEGFLASVDHSAGESRDMATLAGRAADEAKRISDESRSAIETARDEVRAEIESMVAGVRSELDEALRSTSESVASARAAADEAQQRSREAGDQIEQSLSASREAAASAEAAADAARRSAEGIEQAAAEARERMGAVSTVDPEAVSRIEQSLEASREAAAAAERAAEDARNAAREAMSHAAEAKAPATDAGIGAGAHELLDRLEADYKLLTELVQNLHSRLAGIGAPTASVATVAEPEPAAPAAAEVPDVAAAEHAEATTPSDTAEPAPTGVWDWQASTPAAPAEQAADPWSVWSGAESEAATESEEEAAPEAKAPIDIWSWREESHAGNGNSTAIATPEDDASATETQLQPTASDEAPASTAWWSTPQSYTFESTASSDETSTDVEADAATEPVAAASPEMRSHEDDTASAEAVPAAEEVEADPPSAWHWAGAVEEEKSAEIATASPSPALSLEADVAWPPAPAAVQPAGDVTETVADEEAPKGEAVALSGKVVLNVSPVPDFDRLLSLDGALGRLPCIRNVTLADYAKEEVTFRLEMNDATSVDEFTSELARAGGQSLAVTAVAPGQLDLKIVVAGA
ncbi:MAG TPA: hypothetical protein VH951_06110 [Dehalococcoidia bacterium]